MEGFPNSSVGKEPTFNAGDPGSIPGLGRSTGEGNGYPLQFWHGEFHGLYRPRGCKESDTTERLSLLMDGWIDKWMLHVKQSIM